ncbi:hypothetical protein PybrP1_012201 [[Pythium] brassicae (nom. inval.)]|nr:hypothetical protein PybrP1_012201 [[Pythium] brassicae (nom. inval.)]
MSSEEDPGGAGSAATRPSTAAAVVGTTGNKSESSEAAAMAAETQDLDDDDDEDDEDDDDNADVEEVEADECCICRDVVQLLSQGFLPVCAHKFHFECIVAWSKVTNLCPLCKQPFREVTRVDVAGAVVHREAIPDLKQVFRPDPADHDIAAQLRLVHEARCEVCGRGDDEHVLLMCEARGCPVTNHTYCIGLGEVPDHSWYCARHASGARASDFIARPATTVSSRRTTRRLAHLMSNVLSGRNAGPAAGNARRSGRDSGLAQLTGARARRPAASARVTLESESGRPIRGIAAAYAVRMSQELQQIHRRAELMYARGDHNQLALGAPPATRQLALSRSTVAAPATSFVDLLWQDLDAAQLEIAAAASSGRESSGSARTPPSRVSPTLPQDYRELAKLMVDAVGSDNYASTVSLVIPKTAKLRLVSRVKAFFARLNARESVAVLDMGCLELLHKWLQPPAATASAAVSPHPQVLEAVLAAVEALPVRQKDLVEVPAFQSALDEIAAMVDVGVELRERAILTSERWRSLNPPPPAPAAQSPSRQTRAQSSAARDERASQPALPAIRAWAELAVTYVKAKLYPLYKHGNGKLSKERFKAIVKQVAGAFKTDVAAMQSQVVLANGELSSIAKMRLRTLIDRAYKGSSASAPSASMAIPSSVASASSSYSAVPPSSSKHRRIS